MPEIIVTAGRASASGESAVLLRERVNVSDFESRHFASLLVQRLGWAVGDADEVERDQAVQKRLRPAVPTGASRARSPA